MGVVHFSQTTALQNVAVVNSSRSAAFQCMAVCQLPAPNSDHIVIREELLTATVGNLVIREEITVDMFCNFVRGGDNCHGL